jgi:hypothetical protein
VATLMDYLPDADALLAAAAEDLGMILLEMAQNERGIFICLELRDAPLERERSELFNSKEAGSNPGDS